MFAVVFFLLFFQNFARRAKFWKNKSFKYLAAAGESAYDYATAYVLQLKSILLPQAKRNHICH